MFLAGLKMMWLYLCEYSIGGIEGPEPWLLFISHIFTRLSSVCSIFHIFCWVTTSSRMVNHTQRCHLSFLHDHTHTYPPIPPCTLYRVQQHLSTTHAALSPVIPAWSHTHIYTNTTLHTVQGTAAAVNHTHSAVTCHSCMITHTYPPIPPCTLYSAQQAMTVNHTQRCLLSCMITHTHIHQYHRAHWTVYTVQYTVYSTVGWSDFEERKKWSTF